MNAQKLIISFVILSNIFFNCTKTFSEMDYENCIFLPYWQCKDGFSAFNSNYSGVINERPTDYNRPNEYTQIDEFDVCCKTECGHRKVQKYIDYRLWSQIGNSKASIGEFPWMLELLHNEKYHCGASLIHPKVALTAAHCVSKNGFYRVRGGVWNRLERNEQTNHQSRFVQTIIVHPDYQDDARFLLTIDPYFRETALVYDLALLILTNPFDLDENVKVICLQSKVSINADTKCVATGWGRSNGNYNDVVLKKVELTVVNNNWCVQLWQQATRRIFNVHPSSFCAGGVNQDTCEGDGGSPLVCSIPGEVDRYVQVGIVSWGLRPCGRTIAPGIYTNVPLFKNWIHCVMSQHGLLKLTNQTISKCKL